MLSLQREHITNLYCLVDDFTREIERSPHTGRPSLLSPAELATALVWNSLTVRSKTLKDIHAWLRLYHQADFPKIPKYSAFVDQCHKELPLLLRILRELLATGAPIRIMDATMLPVSKPHRADSHKVARGIAAFGRNHQGWHYGFKLHASVDIYGRLCRIALTPASVYDAQMMPKILDKKTKVAVGDTLYGARVMGRRIFEEYGTIVSAPPFPKQQKKLMARWQHFLLEYRPKIESVFDYLKEHLHLVSSFPRSVGGYLLHYARVLLGYQIWTL
jgi:Transposase DDE domain